MHMVLRAAGGRALLPVPPRSGNNYDKLTYMHLLSFEFDGIYHEATIEAVNPAGGPPTLVRSRGLSEPDLLRFSPALYSP